MPDPEFRSAAFLRDHVRQTMAFYHPRCLDPAGGFHHFFRDDGTVYDRETRHLVSSTRFVFNYAMAYRQFGDPDYLAAARHGLAFLREVHRDLTTGGYAWLLRWRDGEAHVLDATNHCYGLAFVVLAYAHALMAGVTEARPWLDEAYGLMERHFWEPEHGLYADEAGPDWVLRDYRGQNANMHACEALLAAFDATGAPHFLERAECLAESVTCRLAIQGSGQIWEHYRRDWTADWDYNRHDRSNIFRPWGYQPGHFAEWSKLLLILERHRPLPWLLPRARELFARATTPAWDPVHGGLVYGLAPDGSVCDGDKYFWVQAEALAAAALLAARTNEPQAWDWYQALWSYSWAHFVDHQHGAWYRILRHDNRKYSDEKSPAGKTDYHTMGACYEVLNVLGP